MGTYDVQQFMDTFGGLPDPGEAAIDVTDLADRQRDELNECPSVARLRSHDAAFMGVSDEDLESDVS